MILVICIAALCIMLASLAGVLFASKKLNTWMHRNLKYLITFSLGVFLVIAYHLFEETFHESSMSMLQIVCIAIAGAVVLELFSRLIPEAHHHHEIEHGHSHSRIDARRMLLGDAIHNIGDGLLLVPAFLVDIRVGIVTTVGIILHELVQEISEFFVLKEAGYSTSEALVKNFFVSATIFIGIFLSLTLTSVEVLETPVIAFAAGGFLYVIFRDLLPSTITSVRKSKSKWKYALSLGLGILVMYAVNTFVPHEPEYPEDLARESSSSIHSVS